MLLKYILFGWVNMREYFDGMFNDVDSNIKLDDDQIRIITNNDKYLMVIAGAGSGKTTTICAKVNYLLDKCGVCDDEILVISFTNKAVSELNMRINGDFNHNVSVMTFHKFGYEIIKENTSLIPKVVKDGSSIVKDYIERKIINDSSTLKLFMDFFIYYFDIDEDFILFSNYDKYCRYKNKLCFPTLKQKLEYIKESINSLDEVLIANYLYMNGIRYDYKKCYQFDDRYKPDFTIYSSGNVYYIEYFKMNKISRFKYYRNIKLIQRIHKMHHTNLIEVYEGSIIDDLCIGLKRCNVDICVRDINYVFDRLVIKDKDSKYIRFVNFCLNFITLFKSKGYDINDFDKLNSSSKRSEIFFHFMKDLFLYYQKYLNDNNLIDFDDMIIKANEIIESHSDVFFKYKYIIIDEYQDISDCRFNLIRNISKKINSNIMVVGDDWQSIYSFASSNIKLFTDFQKLVGDCTVLKIVKTYRNSQQLIDAAGKFILKNSAQISKKLQSPKKLENPIKILIYNNNIDDALYDAVLYLSKKYPLKSILILGRYSFDKSKIIGKKFFEKNGKIIYQDIEMDYMTIHASKGLGYDNVILINALNDVLGFPSKIKNDPILDELITIDSSIRYAEERRLFYVALTRTKNEVVILTPGYNESMFVKEISRYKGVKKYKKLHTIK